MQFGIDCSIKRNRQRRGNAICGPLRRCAFCDERACSEETSDDSRTGCRFLFNLGCLKLATAESCAGGLIAAALAGVRGSGQCLDVGFVAYSPTGKAGFLGVRRETMERYGLTSRCCAPPVPKENSRGIGPTTCERRALTGFIQRQSNPAIGSSHEAILRTGAQPSLNRCY